MKNKFLKKLAAASLAAAMIFSMAACGNADNNVQKEMPPTALLLPQRTLPALIKI